MSETAGTDKAASPEERDALAGELALGLLEGETKAQALRLRLSDRHFADAVEAWVERLGPLFAGVTDVVPPVRVWSVVEAQLGTDIASQTIAANDRALRRWRMGALVSGALAASLAVMLLRPQPVLLTPQGAPKALVVAQLVSPDSPMVMTTSYDPTRGELRVSSSAMPQSDKLPELWVIPADGVPRSLGLVSVKGSGIMHVPIGHRKLMADGVTLAITMEAREGAPHAAPTGAPILAGKISTI